MFTGVKTQMKMRIVVCLYNFLSGMIYIYLYKLTIIAYSRKRNGDNVFDNVC